MDKYAGAVVAAGLGSASGSSFEEAARNASVEELLVAPGAPAPLRASLHLASGEVVDPTA